MSPHFFRRLRVQQLQNLPPALPLRDFRQHRQGQVQIHRGNGPVFPIRPGEKLAGRPAGKGFQAFPVRIRHIPDCPPLRPPPVVGGGKALVVKLPCLFIHKIHFIRIGLPLRVDSFRQLMSVQRGHIRRLICLRPVWGVSPRNLAPTASQGHERQHCCQHTGYGGMFPLSSHTRSSFLVSLAFNPTDPC